MGVGYGVLAGVIIVMLGRLEPEIEHPGPFIPDANEVRRLVMQLTIALTGVCAVLVGLAVGLSAAGKAKAWAIGSGPGLLVLAYFGGLANAPLRGWLVLPVDLGLLCVAVSVATCKRRTDLKARRWPLFALAVLATLLLLPGQADACACCSNAGDYRIGMGKPSAYELGILKQVRFRGPARLFLTEAGMEENARGLAHRAEGYSLAGSLVGNVWRLNFREGAKAGTLNLPLPAKMLSYSADIHDGQTSGGGGPLLYKEWRFEGPVNGTGFFQAGIIAPTRYFLVLQGRGNGCQNAEDFTHWRLEIKGRKADYAFYGELAKPE
jgi:hypothetical protein